MGNIFGVCRGEGYGEYFWAVAEGKVEQPPILLLSLYSRNRA